MRRWCAALLVLAAPLPAQDRKTDVVVYGATAGGVMAAIAAAGEGVPVLLLEPGRHVGGMVSGGLGRTDMDRQEHVIGGLAREFFERVGKAYGKEAAWTFEPKVAEKTLLDWLAEAKVDVLFEHEIDSVEKEESRITRIRTRNGAAFLAAVYIDSSYEGDLMKLAGVSHEIGREGRAKYYESLSGRTELLPGEHQFSVAVSPYGADGALLPLVQTLDSIGRPGDGDKKIQAYCFRICLTRDPANRLPLPKPAGYDAARYGLVRNHMKALGPRAELRDFIGINEMPNGKTDINSRGPVSTNLLGASWDYPEAPRARRREIWNQHLTWSQGLLWYLGHEPDVPERVRAEMNRWGLAKDEFEDTGHWPHQLYVREGRRMIGDYILTQHDLTTHRTKHDSIGMGGYNIDIREVQWVALPVWRFPRMSMETLMEGYVSAPVEPYEIPYRSLLPWVGEAENLIVSTCISASHVAYASFRMEPQYMIAGHAAGVAAALAAKTKRGPQRIDVKALQERLRAQGQILSLGRD